jgi:hypothetical protein
MTKAAAETMTGFVGEVKRTRMSSKGRTSVGVVSGQLRRSLIADIKVEGKNIKARAYFSHKAKGVSYSAAKLNAIVNVHEFGTKGKGGKLPSITPKRSNWLTVPLPAALTRSGRPKKKRARDWPNTFIFKSRKGKLLIAQRHGKQLVFLYVLKKKVDIAPRLHYMVTWRRWKREKALPHLRKRHKEFLKRYNRG